MSVLKFCANSLTSLSKGAFRMSNSVDLWNLRISLRATVPGLNLRLFLGLASAEGCLFWVGTFFRVFCLAVCLTLAMLLCVDEACKKCPGNKENLRSLPI